MKISVPESQSHLLEDVDGVGELSVHDSHLPPDLPDVLLHLGCQSVEGVGLVGEDSSGDRLELGGQVVVHLSARQLNKFRDLYRHSRLDFFLGILGPECTAKSLTLKMIC